MSFPSWKIVMDADASAIERDIPTQGGLSELINMPCDEARLQGTQKAVKVRYSSNHIDPMMPCPSCSYEEIQRFYLLGVTWSLGTS